MAFVKPAASNRQFTPASCGNGPLVYQIGKRPRQSQRHVLSWSLGLKTRGKADCPPTAGATPAIRQPNGARAGCRKTPKSCHSEERLVSSGARGATRNLSFSWHLAQRDSS